jgi:hypothetical protein
MDESTRENLIAIYLYAQQPEKAVKAIEFTKKAIQVTLMRLFTVRYMVLP